MKTSSDGMISDPTYRCLRGYALDPGFSTRLDTAAINEVVYRVEFESLKPGPRGEYVAVVDFDPASKCWYEPVDLGDEIIASQQGLAPSEGNPQFHQQFVYAVVMKTIRHFERALGRKIIWLPRRYSGNPADGYVGQLRVYPHGFRDANAYYDGSKRALLFGYFTAARQTQGANYPGGLVFTCLSPDIVAHETTHAILDSIHPRYMEDTNPDVAAFHEGIADIVALLQRFTFKQLVEHQLFGSRGRIDGNTVFGELATQFGEALQGNRGALRSMIGRWNGEVWQPLKPDPSDYQVHTEAHERGAVLVATIFDVFQRIYRFRTDDLLRIATGGTGVLPEGAISRDLASRLAREAGEIAEHLLHICIRALDYCPPVDISFGNYLRALITADLDIAPEDEAGYRLALIEAFRARGIFPHRVNTLSVESLRWDRPQFTDKEARVLRWLAGALKPDIREIVETKDRRLIFEHSERAKARLQVLLMGKQDVLGREEWESFLNKLGLSAQPVVRLFGRDSAGVRFVDRRGGAAPQGTPPIEVHTLRPAFRAGREGRQVEQVVISLTQSVRAEIGDADAPQRMVFRGGCTLILRLGSLDEVEYVITKSVTGYRRFREQMEYLGGGGDSGAQALYGDGSREARLDFNHLHHH